MFGPFVKQMYASIGLSCLFVTFGFIIGMQSILIPELRADNTGIQLSLDQESWILSSSFISMLLSQPLSGYLSYKFGRRLMIILSSFPMIATLTLFNVFCSYESLLAGSFLYGIANAGFSIGPMYIAEVTSPKYRNILLNTRLFGMHFGLLMAHLLGGLFHWKDVMPFGFVTILAGLITSVSSPESPTWLASKGKFDECRKTFEWFRGNDDKEELEKLIASRTYMDSNTNDIKVKRKSQLIQTYKNISDKSFLKAMGLCVACILFIDMNGKNTLNFYFLDIFSTMLGKKSYAFLLITAIDVIDLITTSLSFVTVKKFTMRSLLFKTGFSAVFINLLFCLSSYLCVNNMIPSWFRWINIVLIIVYLTTLNVGVIPTLYCILNEVVPLSHRELGLSISGVIYISILIFTIKFTPYLLKYLDLHGTFLIIAVILTISLLHLFFNLPETRNKTLQDIDLEITRNNRRKNDIVPIRKETEEGLIMSKMEA